MREIISFPPKLVYTFNNVMACNTCTLWININPVTLFYLFFLNVSQLNVHHNSKHVLCDNEGV